MADKYAPDDIRSYFEYTPNKDADIFFISFFGALCIAQTIQAYRSKQYWLHSLAFMAAMESGGYLAHYLLILSPNGNAFKAELILIILAPNLLALCCYILLGKIITYVFHTLPSQGELQKSEQNWLMRHPHWVPYFYVCSDLLCGCIQGAGGGLISTATTNSQLNTGKTVEVIGLVIQLFFVATFAVLAIYVYIQMQHHGEAAILKQTLRSSYLIILSLVSLLVLRNAYRTAEFSTGGFTSGYFQETETWYLCFDPTLMSLALLIAWLFNFPKRLPKDCLNVPVVVLGEDNTAVVVVAENTESNGIQYHQTEMGVLPDKSTAAPAGVAGVGHSVSVQIQPDDSQVITIAPSPASTRLHAVNLDRR